MQFVQTQRNECHFILPIFFVIIRLHVYIVSGDIDDDVDDNDYDDDDDDDQEVRPK